MKFLACSRCFSNDSNQRSNDQPVQEITNPLVITKRPVPKILHPQSTKNSEPPEPKQRFPAMLSALKSWPRRRRSDKRKHSSQTVSNVCKSVHIIEPTSRQRARHRAPTRTQRLIRLYEDRASSTNPNIEEGRESHQNFRNKLNTLDLKRMNTVALEEPEQLPNVSRPTIYGKNSYDAAELNAMSVSKSVRKTMLEDFLKERLRIEQTMIDLLNGKPVDESSTKKSHGEDRKVRFKIEGAQNEIIKDRCLKDNRKAKQETEIELLVDPTTKVEDFYVERRTTYLKDKTVEDKAVVLKIAAADGTNEDKIGMVATPREMVFCNFKNMTL